ncbi:hypothetical protein BDK51DRAFT_28997 [Blyttiomyces helicus]|uniref:Leucine-rich repeat-containing N-terminal plant-type domain-containing protein n=1 Tax=Blyttiomyces helicus TaxID=388810 RepID=A0A4P9WKK3_9FUNG|nr:hypothetical protein BDK51DRAFT_28997 [Blyttiomyces helicus]|eukprot:RKO93344.1 hypothetical protein BDK51DRAFT_28997 [Blyttiomyces helicus]
MRLPSLILIFFLTFLMHIAATTAQPQAVPPAGSSCADLLNVLPPQWQKNLNLTAPANATANPNWCCDENYICCGETSVCDNNGGMINGIYFQGMQLNGSIPEGLGSLTSLQQLSEESMDKTAHSCPSRRNLINPNNIFCFHHIPGYNSQLFNNSLAGTIPESLGNLVNLTELNLFNNSLTGTIPESLGNLVNLTELALFSNQLSGTIPDVFGNLTKLQILSEDSMDKTAHSCPSRRNLINPNNIFCFHHIPGYNSQLFNNSLTSTIPESLGNLVNLTDLEISSNLLSGPIPDVFGNLTKLQILNLRNNSFTGPIPESLVNLVNLTALDLYSNQLNGSIPGWFENLTNLTVLVLGHNQLSGSIPEGLGNLRGLNLIDLERNQLSGPVPNLSNLTNLTNCFVNNLNSMCMPEFLRNIDATRACIGWIRLPACGGSSNPLPTLVILGIAAGSILFSAILSCILLSLNRRKTMPKRTILMYICQSWKKFWGRPSYESTEAEALRLGVTVILLVTFTDGEDDAIWDRGRIIDFVFKFVDNPNGPFEKKINCHWKGKVKTWGPQFMLILLDYYKQYEKQNGLHPSTAVAAMVRIFKYFLDK